MPGNEVEDEIYNLCDLDNSSQSQHLSQVLDCSWWPEKLQQGGVTEKYSLNSYYLQQSDFEVGHGEFVTLQSNLNKVQLHQRPENFNSPILKNSLNESNSLLGFQNFQSKQNQSGIVDGSLCYSQQILAPRGFAKSQQEYECADSPTLTTNSERSEITEASSDFIVVRGQQQFSRDLRLGTPQLYPMQQSGYSDIQLLQQHMMFKQLQELQRQQQLQQLGDMRQLNSFNQLSSIGKQAAGGQYSPLFNGSPVHDAPQMLRNWMQRDSYPVSQGMSNKGMFPHDQGQAVRSLGLSPPQLDASLYGTPISSTRSNMGQYPFLQGNSHDSANLLPKSSVQAQKSMMQVPEFGNPYLRGDQSNAPSDFACLSLTPKLNVGHVPVQDLNGGVLHGNLREGNTPQSSSSVKEFSERQGTTKQHGSSQNSVPLDPMEAKILYNMDGNIWDAFGGNLDTGIGGFGNAMEQLDSSNAFPSLQSGSWSALMQSAVAETSSTDTGLQEEWSGLTFQNTDQSTDNQISNFVDSEKQHACWAENNLHAAGSFSPKTFQMINDSNMSSNFPILHQPELHREEICQTGANETDINVSENLTSKGFNNSEMGLLAEFQRNSRAPEEVANRGDRGSNSSVAFPGFVLPDRSNFTVQSSGHMLELMHKVDQSRGDSPMRQFGSANSNSLHEVPGAAHRDASEPYAETSSSSVIGLRLAPPSQRLPQTNNFLSPQDFPLTQSNINSKQVSVETQEKSKSLFSPPTYYQSLQPLHELSHKAHGGDRATVEQRAFSSSLNVQGNYVASSTSTVPYTSNQLEMHPVSNVLVASQSLQATLPGNIYFPSKGSSLQDSSGQIHDNSAGKQFPVLEASFAPHSCAVPGMSQDGGNAARPMNVWRNVANPRQAFNKETSNLEMVPKILDTSQSNVVPQEVNQGSEASALTSGSLLSHSQQHDLNKVMHRNNLESFGPSQNQHQYDPQQAPTVNSVAHTVLETQAAATPEGQMLNDNSARYVHPKDSGTDLASHSTPYAHTKMLNISEDVGDGPSLKSSLQFAVQARPSMGTVGQYDAQIQSSNANVPSSHSNHSQINLQMAPSWFKQYGTIRNGQIIPMYNAGLAKPGASQLTLVKSFQNLHNHTLPIRLSATHATDGGEARSNPAATLVANQNMTTPFVQPLDVANQMSIVKSKKRKLTELLPWHKEVTQDSMRFQNISLAEQEWARAANRLVEKVEDELEIIEDLQPLPRAKRRLVKTRQLMQQLFCPAPASVFSGDSTSNYNIVSYFISRLSTGDACSLSYHPRNNLLVPSSKSDKNMEKQENSEQTLQAIQKYIDRAKNLENVFQRLDKTASVVDLRVEFLELERFSVINRFAKFHIRSPDAPGSTSSSATMKPHPQRFITVFPITRNPPEGVQCLSL